MWQEILAVDSHFAKLRTVETQNVSQSSLPPSQSVLPSLYLKRRLQLLQVQTLQSPNAKPPDSPMDKMECSNERDEAAFLTHRPVVRNRKYLSLRIKLLKRQFGLPSDVMSLKSLSISGPHSRRLNHSDANKNQRHLASATSSASGATERCAYNGVDRVLCSSSDPVSRVRFAHNSSSFLAAASHNGSITIYFFDEGTRDVTLKGHNGPLADFDISQSDELIVSGALDGSLILWHVQTGQLIRKLNGEPVTACRFMPGNNNLVVTVCHSLVYLLNISTGKFTGATCSLIQGHTRCVEINELGTLMWIGNDRGYIESFRLESNLNKIHKGCRVLACTSNRAVTSLSSHTPVRKLGLHPCLMATICSEDIFIYGITDANGSISPLRTLTAGIGSHLQCSVFSRLLLSQQGTCVVAGAQDGTVLFFDIERDSKPCINKLLGHSTPVISICYSHNEKLLATADQSGQIIVWKKSVS